MSTPANFAEYITAHLDKPFAWGENDCIGFAVGWVEIATGRDYLSAHRPWANEAEAMRLIKRLGGLKKLFNTHLKRIEPNYARDGDITLIDKTVYLFSGSQVVSVGKTGLVFKSRQEAPCAWSY